MNDVRSKAHVSTLSMPTTGMDELPRDWRKPSKSHRFSLKTISCLHGPTISMPHVLHNLKVAALDYCQRPLRDGCIDHSQLIRALISFGQSKAFCAARAYVLATRDLLVTYLKLGITCTQRSCSSGKSSTASLFGKWNNSHEISDQEA